MRVPPFVLAVLILVPGVLLVSGKAEEMVFDFEADQDRDGLPDHWTPAENTRKNAFLDSSVKISGKSSLRIEDKSEWEYALVSRMADVKPNTRYRLKAWARSEKTTGPTCIYIAEYSPKGRGSGLLQLHVLFMEQPREWKELEKEFTTTDRTGQIRIELCPVGFAIMHTGTAWFDDIRIEEIQREK